MRPIDMLFPELAKAKAEGLCPFCGLKVNPVTDFRDGLSAREHRISGLCQKCQDKMFGK